ncbi:MAG: two-component regulator propeller domain-containing protein [candidate division KSB1 bacterium]|nr:two-component regulator propeller domain-containing protein [candidate division KSB1 bacterium]
MKNKLFLILFFLLMANAVHSQYKNLRFTHLSTADGLSRSHVTCSSQDARGFMWFGTSNGLNRYDGYDFSIYTYHQNDPYSISHNYISSICQDADGKMWVGTSDGLNVYDHAMHHFETFKHSDEHPGSISDDQIEAIIQDRRGRLWIGTRNGGVDRYDSETGQFIHYQHEDGRSGISGNDVRVLFEDSGNRLWLGHWNGGIDIYEEQTDTFVPLFEDQRLTQSGIMDMAELDSCLWIGTQSDGLYKIDLRDLRLSAVTHYRQSGENSLASNSVLSLMPDKDGHLWIGTENGGLDVLDVNRNVFYHNQVDPFDPGGLDSQFCLFNLQGSVG